MLSNRIQQPNDKNEDAQAGQLKLKGVNELWKATQYSAAGLRDTFVTESAFRMEILLALVLVPLAVWLPLSLLFKAMLVSTVLLVLMAELFNTAIEAVVDMATREFHQLAKKAKDVGSAAVLLALANLAVVWAAAFFEVYGG